MAAPTKAPLDVIKRGDVYQFRWNAGQTIRRRRRAEWKAWWRWLSPAAPTARAAAWSVIRFSVTARSMVLWGYWGVNERGPEKAERTGGSGIAGDYNLNGKNPNGSAYKGTLSITHERWRLRIRVEQ